MATDLGSSDAGNTMGSRTEAPTRELPVAAAAASEDRCVNCGAPLAHDQQYCVECGERRGQSKFPVAQPATEMRSRRVRAERAPRAPRASSGTTLVAGVGVLLLAIGLGVLIGRIGHNNSNQKAAAATPSVITVNGGGGSSAASTAQTTTTHAPAAAHRLTGKLKKAASATAPPSKAVQQKAVQAANKVLGNSKNLAPPTVTTGGSCSNSQAGCQGNHFTGNFFGQ